MRQAAPAIRRLIMGIRSLVGALAAAPLLVVPHPCWSAAPVIYSAPAHQSPVHAEPDDLLLLPGDGFESGDRIVYQAVTDTMQVMSPPALIPQSSTSRTGLADLVSVVDAPYSLTIHLPTVIDPNQSYLLWVVNPVGEWSNGVKINDARPLWISPAEVYPRHPLGALPRTLKIVGRNLQPADGEVTRVKLIGRSVSYDLQAQVHPQSAANIDGYVAAAQLPAEMTPGSYEVRVSRDGTSWVPLFHDSHNRHQALVVSPEPAVPADFPVGNYSFGQCAPGESNCTVSASPCKSQAGTDGDQTACIAAAIEAARAAGGGTVLFGPGTWNLDVPADWRPGHLLSAKGVSPDGLIVPQGVNLRGSGAGVSRVVRGPRWDAHVPSFALLGFNQVNGLTFSESRVFKTGMTGTGFLMLGTRWDRVNAYRPTAPFEISHVVISENEFDKPYLAIGSDGVSLDHVIIDHNIFGAFATAIAWEGNAANLVHPYHFSDSIIAYNTFLPGSSLDLAAGQGAIATGMSGGERIDFSDNTADGAATRYFYDPANDAKGWRAAFFWAMHDNVETTLVSHNRATCTGDKGGDGEAIAFDNNHNRPGFSALAVPVVTAQTAAGTDSSAVTLRGALIAKQSSYGTWIEVTPTKTYYVGDWLQVVRGPGIGQARKILQIKSGVDAEGALVTLTVAPALDVLPRGDSLAAVDRVYWQTYTIGNTIDHRTPLCQKSNRTRPSGGLIVLDASTVDSVVAGNAQFDTSGIQLSGIFQPIDPAAGISFPSAFFQSSNEIRGNEINGDYEVRDARLAKHGIALGFGASPHAGPPPVVGFGLAISHNSIIAVGGSKGGISLNHGWYTGPVSQVLPGVTPWKLAINTLLFKNTMSGVNQSLGKPIGIGISAGSTTTPIEWRSTLYGNTCDEAIPLGQRFVDLGTQTVAYCPSASATSCDCGSAPSDVAVSVVVFPVSTHGAYSCSRQYSLEVRNDGPGKATAVTLSAEPNSGSVISSMGGALVACNIKDANISLCRLGALDAGASRKIDVVIASPGGGATASTYSLGHKEPDVNPQNDSVLVKTDPIQNQTNFSIPCR